MPGQNLYLLHFNGRDDNLGDQFIFRALAEALGRLGAIHMRGGLPAFMTGDPAIARGDVSSGHVPFGLRLAGTLLRGGAVYSFLPPGGRTWTAPADAPRDMARGGVKSLVSAARTRGVAAVAGRRIAIGASVIPAANHAWCRDCEWIGVRDHESLRALRAAGMPRVDYFPDLAFLPAPSRAAAAHTHIPRQGLVASFRQSIPEARGASAAVYAAQLSAAFAALLRELTPDERHRARAFHQVEEDAPFARDLSQTHRIGIETSRVTLDSFDAFYRSADIVISNRLHCLLIGASCGAVPVALTSRAHTKVAALFETVGWQALLLRIEEGEALPRRVAAIRRDLPRLRQMVASSFAEQRHLGLALLAERFGRGLTRAPNRPVVHRPLPERSSADRPMADPPIAHRR